MRGFYLYITTPDGITHLRFERTEDQAHETWRAIYATLGLEAKIVEARAA